MSNIALKLRNDLALPVSLNVLGGTSDESNQNNANTLYEWNLATENFVNVDTIIIQSRLSGQTIYQNLSTSLNNFSFQGVALALSTLNVGNFLNAGSIIYTYNSDIEFGDITLTLTNIPASNSYLTAMYQHFVPAGTPLQQFVYPTEAAFESDFGPALNLLFQQTNAASVIDTYGLGCIYPIIPVSNLNLNIAGSYFFEGQGVSSPKAALMQPIMSSNTGTQQGYNLDTNNKVNAILFAPSGDFLEIPIVVWFGAASYIMYFDPANWNFFNLQISNSALPGSSSGMLNDLPNYFGGFNFSTNTIVNYPNGWNFPDINNGVQLQNWTLDGQGISPRSNFTNPDNFNFSNTYLGNFFPASTTVESYHNIRYNPTGNMPFSYQNRSWLFQFCGTIFLSSTMNTVYQNGDGNYSLTWNVGFSNDLVIWDDLNTFIRWNGFDLIKMDGVAMTAFPRIQQMNFKQLQPGNNDFQLSLNLSDNEFSSSQVNQILIDLNDNAVGARTNIFSSTINLSAQQPSAPPSGGGITAKNALIAKGITVITD